VESAGYCGHEPISELCMRNLIGDEEAGKSIKIEPTPVPDALDRLMHRTIKKVGQDLDALHFNTAIAELIS